MTTEFKKIVFATVLILCATLPIYADWQPSDGHKMHFPQLPNPMGWDIDLRPYELADDWQCSKTGDVNDIHFWISWQGDIVGTIPNIQVKIYSNDPNIPSKPAQQLWSQTIYDFTVRPIDPNGHEGYWIPTGPNSPPTLYPNDHNHYYQINIKNIPTPFHQVEGQIYWLSLKIPTTTPSTSRVGWKTSLNHFMDAAVAKFTPPPGGTWKPLYEPNSTIPIDFAFVITGGLEPNEEPNYHGKWLQKPDLTDNGIDVMASSPLILADDFLCTKSTLITDITIWGSWRYDILPPGGPNNVAFTLSIHSDIPAGPNNAYSKPGPMLWWRYLTPNEVTIQQQDINEGWWNPYYGEYISISDYKCWKYVFHIPEANAFCQQGEPNWPIVYWLDVQAYPNDSNGYAKFGWKSSINHWNDDAVWSYGSEPNVGWWEDLHYPSGHPYNPNSIDLAFAIDGNIPCANEPEPEVKWRQRPDLTTNGLDIAALDPCTLADDFECNKSTLITDITIWGSWKNDVLPPGGANDVWFTLSIHSDIPASQSWTGYSMPNEVLWLRNLTASEVSIERAQIDEGWWDPIFMEYLPIGDHTCWKYVFHIPEANAFCQQGEPNHPIVYWLDVQAHPNDPNSYAKFGWKSSIDHWNDDAVYTYFDEPHTGVWYELRYPTGHPLAGQSIDLAFVIDGNIPCVSEPTKDLGDAPDSSNNFGAIMTAYPSGVAANYPTVYAAGSPPFGPIHLQPKAKAWLGPNVTLENEADLLPDQDGITNIDPLNNSSNQDGADDGVLNMPLALTHCCPNSFQYQVNVVNADVNLYVNVWFDWNRDGDWDDNDVNCWPNPAPEWAVRNQLLPAGSLPVGLNTITTPQFRPWHPLKTTDANIWMRITLSEQPWVNVVGLAGYGGSGPATGYLYGETEDYYFKPQKTECMKPTAFDYNDWVKWNGPCCWCCRRQCRGDSDCKKIFGNWVTNADLNLLKNALSKNDACLATISWSGVPGICADFDHKSTFGNRVTNADLTTLKKYLSQPEVNVPCCDYNLPGTAPDCNIDCNLTGDRWYFWTN